MLFILCVYPSDKCSLITLIFIGDFFFLMTIYIHICYSVMNNSELPLDPNMQACNLLITFLKYASIVMQDTKGKQGSLCSLLN